MNDLPKIIYIESREDSGEYGNASCPHCGADGRYVTTFRCEDGTRRGAMAGCIKLFPISPLAKKHEYLIGKAADYAKKGWALNRADTEMLDVIEAAGRGEIELAEAERRALTIDAGMKAWRKARRQGR